MVDYANIELEQGLLRTDTPFRNSFRFEGQNRDGTDGFISHGLLFFAGMKF